MAGENESGAPQWPEVYKLIDDTRHELSAEIKAVGEKFEKWVLPTENRITLVEAAQVAAEKRMDGHDGDISGLRTDVEALKKQQEVDEAATKALEKNESQQEKIRQLKITWRHWLIGTILAGALAIQPISDLIHSLTK